MAKIAKTPGYLAWHPSGRLLAFSANKLSMFFHSTGEARDVFEAISDLGIYRVDNSYLKNYNRPELVTGAIAITESALAAAVLKPRLVLRPQSTPDAAGGSDRNLLEAGPGEPEYRKAHE